MNRMLRTVLPVLALGGMMFLAPSSEALAGPRVTVTAAPVQVFVPGHWSFDVKLGRHVWVKAGSARPSHRHASWVPGHYEGRGRHRHWVPGTWR